jgi:Peptidase inhibitor family I36
MSVFIRRLVTPFAAAALIGVAAIGQAAPAHAGGVDALAVGECPFTNTLCLFDGTRYTGERITLSGGGICVSLVNQGWGDRARSVINTNSRSAAMFANDDCLGGPFQVSGNTGIADLDAFRPKSVWVP